MAKLNVKAFGLACGIIWSFGMLVMGLINMVSDWGSGWVQLMSSLYPGYTPTVLGSIIGAAWGFVDAGIGGILLAWLYNKFAK